QLMLPSLQDAEGEAVFAIKNELSPDAVRKIGILYDTVRENEKLAAQQNHEDYLTSQMFYLMRIAVGKVINWAAGQIYQGKADLPDDIKVHKEGAIGRIIIIDEPDEERREAILSSLEPFHAVVTTQYPSAWSKTSPVSAMITSACDGIYSHAASRAKEVGAAVGNLPGATRLLRPFNGKWVKISLSGSPKIRLASEEEEAMDRQQHSLLTVSESQTGKVYSIPLLKIDLERDKARFGPKVFKIADMALAGFQVPQSAFITSSLCHLLYQKLELYDAIPKILGDNPLAQEQKVIKQKLRKIKELFTQAETPKQVADILLKLNHGLPGDSRIFRPGLPFEDLPDFNAAGYMDSPVSSNEEKAVLLAMLSGYASYWNLLPFMAREENGLNHFRFLPGAAFMELIAAQAAGNMIVSEENILISAVYGQGQGGNEGRIPPDYYEIDRKTEEIKHTPARERRSKMIFSEGSMVKIDLSLSEATNPPLNDDQVVGIGAEGERAFELYGPQPREVEWAYQNGVWILQDRTAIL
ncbi:MAG: hypothetical protein HQ564_09790, partial [Candidatus Saganbacteria bacterium]|nr:hypothetical protein [Candidatus Saganbacteria bacterium]